MPTANHNSVNNKSAKPAPLVSVVIPAYNHEQYIVSAINSVLTQSLTDLELIVIDDCSTDSTWECISEFSDPRIQCWRHDTNQGADKTLNEGLAHARGHFLAILNSDDAFEPKRLEHCIELLTANEAGLVGSDIHLIDESGEIQTEHWWIERFNEIKRVWHQTGSWPATLMTGNMFMTTSNFCFTRTFLESTGTFEQWRYVPDYAFLLAGLIRGGKLFWVDKPLLKYRLHGSNTIKEKPLQANLEASKLLRNTLPELIRPEERLLVQQYASQSALIERYICEIKDAIKHDALVEKDHDYGKMVADRDHWIAERDDWIAERDVLIAERDRQIEHQKRQLNDGEKIIAEQSKVIENLEQKNLNTQEQLSLIKQSRFFKIRALMLNLKQALPLKKKSMNQTKAKNIASIQSWIQSNRDSINCVSFDIFDTLLQRCIEPPDAIPRRVSTLLAAKIGHTASEPVWQARLRAETKLRTISLSEGYDHEFHFHTLIAEWLYELTGTIDKELLTYIETTELALEQAALTAKPGITELLTWLHQQNFRIIAVSDMYLARSHIEDTLMQAGLSEYIDAIYMSSEYKLGKYSGRLHQAVLAEEQISAEQMVHIGDNIVSDGYSPARLGINTLFLDEHHERLRRRHQTLSAKMANRGGMWRGKYFFEITEYRHKHRTQYSDADNHHNEQTLFFQEYARQFLGPAFSTFNLSLIEQCAKQRPDTIYFLARDGYIFKNLYDRWCVNNPDLASHMPEARYLYVSRKIVTGAAIADGLTLDQAQVAFYNPKQQGIESILRTFGLNTDTFIPLAEKHGFDKIKQPIHDWHDPRLVAFLQDEEVQRRIREHGQHAQQMFKDYLEQEGFFKNKKVGLVDIGWNGTIQKFIQLSFGDRSDCPELHGWYFATTGAIHGRFSDTHGLILNDPNIKMCSRGPIDFEEIFEQGARALEATTLGYYQMDSKIAPILKPDSANDRKGELACNHLIKAMHSGILSHYDDFEQTQRLTGYTSRDLLPYVHGLIERFVAYPTNREIRALGQLVHTEDFGHDHVLDISGAKIRWWQIIRHPRSTYQTITQQAWRYGIELPLPNWIRGFMLRLGHLYRLKKHNTRSK